MPFTLAPGADHVVETEVKHSRFIAALHRVDDAEAATEFVAEQKSLYPDARHHCSAFVIGYEANSRVERAHDDGEPGGTAGVPMLQALKSRDLVDVIVVVTRYFGGIKLGAGGLVRAYSGAVSVALDSAELVAREQKGPAHFGDPALRGRSGGSGAESAGRLGARNYVWIEGGDDARRR